MKVLNDIFIKITIIVEIGGSCESWVALQGLIWKRSWWIIMPKWYQIVFCIQRDLNWPAKQLMRKNKTPSAQEQYEWKIRPRIWLRHPIRETLYLPLLLFFNPHKGKTLILLLRTDWFIIWGETQRVFSPQKHQRQNVGALFCMVKEKT